MNKQTFDMLARLTAAGISTDDAYALRRISMILHRWHELECGDGNDHASWCVVRGFKTNTPYWHDSNPWRDSVVYVPIVELAGCVAGGMIDDRGTVKPYDVPCVLQFLRQSGNKVDAYILPQPSGLHSLGVRHGKAPEQYYSPHNAHPDKTANLLERYKNVKHVASFMHDDAGKPFMEIHPHTGKPRYELLPDRETGAKKRLAKIMASYPDLLAYIQTDPRGASLYILRVDDIPAGAKIDSCYSRGIAVYK